MIIYYKKRPLDLYEDEIIKQFFINEINYTSPSRDKINETLLNKVYLNTQKQVKRLLNETSLLNFINDENNNQFDDRILNMCVIIKKQFFHIHSKATGSQKLSTINTAKWMISAINRMIKDDFKKMNNFVINICNLKRVV